MRSHATLILLVIVLLAWCVPVSAYGSADFVGTPTSGTAPLSVSFTDLSSNNPTGWAWFFGDETYTAPWTQQTASAGWSARWSPSSVAMADGSIILMGGKDSGGDKNDVWRSTDNGTSWTQMTASAGWAPRHVQSVVAMPDGSIVLMGGYAPSKGGNKNDVWRSTDNGATWTLMTASAGWSPRQPYISVVLPDASILLMGGCDYGNSGKVFNDVWRSTDNGATWTQMTPGAGWSPRHSFSSVVMPDGSVVLMGGSESTDNQNKNDVWRSTDKGATWTLVNAGAAWTVNKGHGSVVVPDGSIVLMGGDAANSVSTVNHNVWRSTDNGITWALVNAGPGWTARSYLTSVIMPDGSIVLMGGSATDGLKNDVWRFNPVGSSLQNPSHTYTAAGVFQVALQAYNAGGYNSTRKTGYNTVTRLSVPPTPTPLSVTAMSPSTGTNDQSISATVTGTGFKPGAVVKLTLTGQPDIVASGVTLTGNSIISCTFDLTGKATGTWDLAVTNPVDGTTSVRSTAFTLTTRHLPDTINGTIIVSSTPQDALVYLDGTLKGTGSVTLLDVSPGYHSVRVSKTMFNDYGTDVRVAAGSTNYVTAVLIPTSGPVTSGTIIASSNPSGANVYLDGMAKGLSPVTITGVSSGFHTISFTKTGYTDASRTVTMTASQTMDITVDLTKTGSDWGDLLNTTTLIIVGIIVLIIAIVGVLLRKKKDRWDNS